MRRAMMLKPKSRTESQVVMFVATTPFAVNSFLEKHIAVLSKHYQIVLCTNLNAYELSPFLLNSIDVCHIPFARRISIWSDINCLIKLVRAIRQVKPIVIHSITPKAGLLAMLSGWLTRVPKRWHTFTGQVWITKKGFSRGVLKQLDRLIVMLSTRVFADSTSQCNFLINEGVIRIGQIELLGQGSIAGVDQLRFCPDLINREQLRKQMGSNVKTFVFLFVGRISRDKGVFDLIQAFEELAITLGDIELWVVGPNDEGLLDSLQESAANCKAPIRWLGPTNSPEVFMAAADILLLPSYREGFGLVIIEAAACGIPAIAYRIDGVIDAIVDGETGLLVEVGEPIAFASAMKRLATDERLRLYLGDQARSRAILEFSSKEVTNAWLMFYENQLKS
jgi:glycosyltransferase involved in cell wall biosynthesis